ncbi:MAG: hypothetical protein AAGA09_09125 [Pseudomonadota bacterium]
MKLSLTNLRPAAHVAFSLGILAGGAWLLYAAAVTPLVNAAKEKHASIRALEDQIDLLTARFEEIHRRTTVMQKTRKNALFPVAALADNSAAENRLREISDQLSSAMRETCSSTPGAIKQTPTGAGAVRVEMPVTISGAWAPCIDMLMQHADSALLPISALSVQAGSSLSQTSFTINFVQYAAPAS